MEQLAFTLAGLDAERQQGVTMSSRVERGRGFSSSVEDADLRFLRVMLGLQIGLGLLWGISMLFFARQIVLEDPSGPHIEKIALEGAAHLALVFGAILVWRSPQQN